MSICGVHIGREYITLARRDGAETGVDSIGIQPLGIHGTYHENVLEGFLEMMEKELFAKKESVIISFDSSASHIFLSQLPSEITDMHEMMSWELMMRVSDHISHYAFDAVPAAPGRAIGVAVREEDIQFYKKLCKKCKLQLVAVDTAVLSLYNVYELNYDATTPAILLSIDGTSISILFVQNRSIHSMHQISAIDDNVALDTEVARIKGEVDNLLSASGISSGVPIYLSGEHLADFSIRDVVLNTLPQCELLNPLNKLPSRAGMDDESIERYSPLIAVAIGLSQKEIL